MSRFLKEISPKINQSYIREKEKDLDAHYGKSPDAKLKFHLLNCLSTIADRDAYSQYIEKEVFDAREGTISNSDRKFVADRFWMHQLYENALNPHHYWLWKAPEDQNGNKLKRPKHWFENRHNSLFAGRLSFLREEGDHLHRGMQYGLGDDWASMISAKEFVRCTMHEFIAIGTNDGLILPWQSFDPILSFKLLAAQIDKNDVERQLKIVPVSSDRPSLKRIGEKKVRGCPR